MREFHFDRLERHRVGGSRERMELSMPLPQSPSGKVYQYSPNPDAMPRLFLLGGAPEQRTVNPEHLHRIRRFPGRGETVCPYSGHTAPDEEFTHVDDVEAVKKQITWEAMADIEDRLAEFARDFNLRQPRGGFISMSMEFKPSRRPRPLAIREDLLRSLECDVCQRAYGVYALALFCPDCGAPNIALHFRREIELVQAQIKLADQQDEAGQAEFAYRLMGNAHEDVLTAFEATLKTVYRHLIRRRLEEHAEELCSWKAIGNAFQNVDRSRERYEKLGIDPFACLPTDDLEHLRLNIQKRHVIGHNLGMADQHYAEITQEQQPGETVRILGEEIARFGLLCLSVIADLERNLLPDARAAEPDSAGVTCPL